MRKNFVVLLVLAFAGLCATAGPAKPGQITLVQPDGHTFPAIIKGDEFGHILMTGDGCAVVQDENGYYSYAYFNASGERFSSGVHVGDGATSDILAESKQIPYDAIRANARERRSLNPGEGEVSILKRIREAAAGTKASGATEKHGLVILAQFSDVSFTYTKDDFVAMLTQSGYNTGGATGSAVEYFNDQFNGTYEFSFTVSSIVTLTNTQAYYGGNDSSGNDLHPELMINDACKLADSEIDFSEFDDDGDGEVDNVFVFFAGGDEAEGAGDDCIWSHAWYLSDGAGISLSLDGVKINRYACTSELTVTGTSLGKYTYSLAGIGTFCHEYSHTFGLPDFYDTDYDTPSGSDIAAGMWFSTSLMDGGNYNNNGNTPPYYNAVERDYLGLSEPEYLVDGTYTLEPIQENGRYLRMDTDTEGEYYLFECRSNDGWDAYINNGSKAVGLLVYHIDKSTSRTIYSDTYGLSTTPYQRWELYNEVNAGPTHQCADLVEADGRSDQTTSREIYSSNLAGLFFPKGNTEFTPESSPAFSFWSGYNSDMCITDIAMDGDNVTFTVTYSDDVTTPTAVGVSAVTFQDAAIISWCSSTTTSRTAYISFGGETYEVSPYETSCYAYVCEGLTPSTSYSVTIWYNNYDGEAGESKNFSFTTKKLPTQYAYPYIYFTTPANSNGSFTKGTKIPLRVYNAPTAISVVWTLAGSEIEVGDDGYYELTSGGTLKAVITYEGGGQEIITRRITVTSE